MILDQGLCTSVQKSINRRTIYLAVQVTADGPGVPGPSPYSDYSGTIIESDCRIRFTLYCVIAELALPLQVPVGQVLPLRPFKSIVPVAACRRLESAIPG